MIRILVVNEGAVETHTIVHTFTSQPDCHVVGIAHDAYEILRQTKYHTPDVIFLDEAVMIADNTNVIPLIKAASPQSGVILLSTVQEDERILEAIRSGASGSLLKNSAGECFIRGARIVYGGGSLLRPETIALAFQAARKTGGEQRAAAAALGAGQGRTEIPISRQEMRLITCIGQGLSTKEIAKNLRLKDGTIRNYISTIFQKTGMRNRAEVAVFARNRGLRRGAMGS